MDFKIKIFALKGFLNIINWKKSLTSNTGLKSSELKSLELKSSELKGSKLRSFELKIWIGTVPGGFNISTGQELK